MRYSILVGLATGALSSLGLFGCAASNPDGGGRTVVHMPDEGPSVPDSPRGTGTASEAPAPSAERKTTAADSAAALEPRPSVSDDRVGLPVALVGGEPIDVRSLLVRAWWTSSDRQRELLDQLIVERLVHLEARRLEVRLDADVIEGDLDRAFAALTERIRESGSILTLDEFIRQVLGLDPGFYESQLRADALVHALLERCVRAHSLSLDHAVVRFLSVDSAEAATGIEARLAAGEEFAALAQELALRPGDGEATLLVKNEDVEISRRAFATAANSWAGPWLSNGRYLFVFVERFGLGFEGSSGALMRAVHVDLESFPIHDLEFSQWHVAMNRRYTIDRRPYQDLVEGR